MQQRCFFILSLHPFVHSHLESARVLTMASVRGTALDRHLDWTNKCKHPHTSMASACGATFVRHWNATNERKHSHTTIASVCGTTFFISRMRQTNENIHTQRLLRSVGPRSSSLECDKRTKTFTHNDCFGL